MECCAAVPGLLFAAAAVHYTAAFVVAVVHYTVALAAAVKAQAGYCQAG